MKRIVNFRPLLLSFVALIGGIYSSIELVIGNITPIIFCALICVLLIIAICIKLIKKSFGNNFAKMLGTKSIFPICFIIIVCISAGLLFANACFNKYNFRDLKNDNYNITATIAEKYDDNDKTVLLLTNIKIENKEYNFCIKGSAENLYVNVKCGDVVNFDGYLYVANLVSNNKLNTYILKNNLQYYAYINVDTLSVIDYEFNLINNF